MTDLLHRREERGLERPGRSPSLVSRPTNFYTFLPGLPGSTFGQSASGSATRGPLRHCRAVPATPTGLPGLLLLTFAAEAARREATEGRLWPHVRRDNSGTRRFGSGVDYELFDYSGHPTDAFKQAIESAAQTFGLRNVLQDLDSQHYYLTVFLQFGFTIRDARLRLGQWLTGATAQTATGHLLAAGGPLRAPGFVCMWETLKNSRRQPASQTVALHLAE